MLHSSIGYLAYNTNIILPLHGQISFFCIDHRHSWQCWPPLRRPFRWVVAVFVKEGWGGIEPSQLGVCQQAAQGSSSSHLCSPHLPHGPRHRVEDQYTLMEIGPITPKGPWSAGVTGSAPPRQGFRVGNCDSMR